MCDRYFRKSEKQHIAEVFQLEKFDELAHEIRPSYNIPPGTGQPVVRLDGNRERELVVMQWTLVPWFSETRRYSHSTSNAPAEGITKSRAFQEAFAKRRCLIPADGFIEWELLSDKTKQPWAFAAKDGSLMGFAGIWDRWKDQHTGDVLESFAMVTTQPNEITVDVHGRSPVVIAQQDYERWLEPGDPARPPVDLLRQFPADWMSRWKIDQKAGNLRNNWPELIDPVADAPKRTLFD